MSSMGVGLTVCCLNTLSSYMKKVASLPCMRPSCRDDLAHGGGGWLLCRHISAFVNRSLPLKGGEIPAVSYVLDKHLKRHEQRTPSGASRVIPPYTAFQSQTNPHPNISKNFEIMSRIWAHGESGRRPLGRTGRCLTLGREEIQVVYRFGIKSWHI